MSDDDPLDGLLRRAFKLPPAPSPGQGGELMRCTSCGRTLRTRRALCPDDGGTLEAVGDSRLGQVVAGHYRLLERLGSGGIGTVYRARHRVLGREVAVKLLRPELAYLPEHRARLTREARVVGQLCHEHIVSVIDLTVGEGDQLLLVMEYLSGRTLTEAIAEGPMSPRRVVHIAMQVTRALARAHGLGVLHRDIKPSNLLLCRVRHDPDFVKLLDFGLARPEGGERLTASSSVVGTPWYMSPEQVRGSELTPPSDLYSLGCVMYEMLAGDPPFQGLATDVLRAHAMDHPPPLSHRAPDAPEPLAAVVMQLLAKDPAARYRDAHHLLEALEAVAAELPSDPGRLSSFPSPPSNAAPVPTPGERLEEHWARRLELARAELAERHGEPHAAALAQASAGLERVSSLGRELSAVLAASDAQAAAHRERAQQLTAALDVLSRDASAHTRELAALDTQLAGAERDHAAAHAALCAAAGDDLPPPSEGEQLSAARAAQLGELAAGVQRLARRFEALSSIRDTRARVDGELADLRFQIDALRGRIASLHVEARTANDAAEAAAGAIHARQQNELEAVAATLDELTGAAPG